MIKPEVVRKLSSVSKTISSSLYRSEADKMATVGDSAVVVSGYFVANDGMEDSNLKSYTLDRSADLEDMEGIEVAGPPSEVEKARVPISKASHPGLCSIM